MADFSGFVEQLQDFDINDVDWERIGVWPAPARILVCLVAAVVIVFAGYYFVVRDKNTALEGIEKEEVSLRQSFERKAHEAANLENYRAQMIEMEVQFGDLVKQLPSSTEVPALLEDIDGKGVQSQAVIVSITPQAERTAEYYVELPIKIVVNGGYHEFGTFVSGIAGMPRIVTLHDFSIRGLGGKGNMLQMDILAKTYRYNEQEGGG